MQPIIITGGPGAGKTSLLSALAQRGYMAFTEVSRTLIRQQAALDDGILPWTDLPRFAALCLEAMGEQRQQAMCGTMPAFVDRAIGDICAYLVIGGEAVAQHYIEAAKGYYPTVFCCAPNQAIYVQDDERPHTFAEAEAIHRQLKQTYSELGYQVVEVPWDTVDNRASWVLAQMRQAEKA
ncbi:ATPase [Photobacterium sanctipauli]|uniref:ATPase n=1 Tax=Photobacterium sanctipauli TaxID=1342794 RepID=A0A2T3NEW8_9GAMM|nr:AAA family ATPase [Photobacterium sanctipauli]PSW13107.1 ATPase [Photobacterium sanctipauli]